MGVIGRRRFLRLTALAAASGVSGLALAAAARTPVKGRVVIVGAGFAGSACALQLRRLDASIDVSLVDPLDYYATCPMSNEVLAGLRNLASITVSRAGVRRAGVRLVRDGVAAIDVGARNVRLEGGQTLAFDRLVVAPGIRFLWNKPDGYDAAASHTMPHAWQAGDQTRRLATQLRQIIAGLQVEHSENRTHRTSPWFV